MIIVSPFIVAVGGDKIALARIGWTPPLRPVDIGLTLIAGIGKDACMHWIDDVPYQSPDGLYQMVVEIPAGTNEKWQTDAETGEFYHDTIAGKPRIINFLPYPMNYGYIPQTMLTREQGGDGDPTDIISLAPTQPRGTISPVRVIGALKLSERGETDTKIVSLLPGGPFEDVDDISQLLMRYPGAVEIIRHWFEGYKGAGSFLFYGYADATEACAMIEAGHLAWRQNRKRHS